MVRHDLVYRYSRWLICFVSLHLRVTKELAELEAKGEVGLDQFLEFSRTHHSLLWPAFQMQLALKKKMMGVGFWQTHAERRVKLSKNKYVKIKDLLQLVRVWCLVPFPHLIAHRSLASLPSFVIVACQRPD